MITDKDYYYSRAEAQLILAQAATHPAALRAHFMLAETYIELAYPNVESAGHPADALVDADDEDRLASHP